MHRGRPMREAFDHCPAGWIRQSRKCCTKIIHNQMVVDNRSMSTANFALRGFCPNVLTLKAVLMMLDLPGPQRRMANRQCAHRHQINTDMSACVCQCDYEAFSTVAHVLARCGLVFPRGCPFIAIANGRSLQESDTADLRAAFYEHKTPEVAKRSHFLCLPKRSPNLSVVLRP